MNGAEKIGRHSGFGSDLKYEGPFHYKDCSSKDRFIVAIDATNYDEEVDYNQCKNVFTSSKLQTFFWKKVKSNGSNLQASTPHINENLERFVVDDFMEAHLLGLLWIS